MPFEKGHKLSVGNKGGRKGYGFEQQQLTKMRTAITKDLLLIKKAQAGKLSPEELKTLAMTQARILKYLDKLHATKSEETKTHEVGDNLYALLHESPSNRDIKKQLPEGLTD